ncbi:MAG: ArnT family glycosyltransferase [Chthoniobacterales bacterium]
MSRSETATRGGVGLHLLVVLVVWAAIYLPGLGTLEIKGEEGRRILPAVTMLQTGNFIVPQVGSDPYFNKPPLVNWLVAASFRVFGERSEWAARFPSTLCVLAVALAFVAIARRPLGAGGSLAGALVWLTNIGLIEKGRQIEIEALYVSISGLAIICWLSWFQERRSPWRTWLVPWFFLGLGLLAKGPLHLVFFYAVVVAVLHCTGELRQLWRIPHLAGVLLMLALFAAWAIPCLRMMQPGDVAHTWSRQFTGRLSGEGFDFGGWLLNVPRGLGYFLPWTLLLPLLRGTDFGSDRRAQMARGLQWAIGLSFLGVSLLPGSLARYTMPLLVPVSWLIAMLLTTARAPALRWPRRVAPALRLPVLVSLIACATIAIYAFAVMPHLQKRAKIKTIAAQINAALPPAEPLYAVDPDYQPFLFYVRDPIVYLSRVAEVPRVAGHLLVQPEREGEALASSQWLPRRARPLLRLKDYRGKQVILLEIAENSPGSG